MIGCQHQVRLIWYGKQVGRLRHTKALRTQIQSVHDDEKSENGLASVVWLSEVIIAKHPAKMTRRDLQHPDTWLA